MTLEITYLDLLKQILAHGEQRTDRTGTGTYSLFGEQFECNLEQEFPLLTTKRVHYKSVLGELRWMLSGSQRLEDLQALGVTIWDEWGTAEQCAKFNRAPGDFGPIYGPLWRSFGHYDAYHMLGKDQIADVISQIQNKPDSRRIIVTGWDANVCDKVALPPCHTLWQLQVSKGKYLNLKLYARSIDAFLGLPFNMPQYGTILHLMAYATNLVPSRLIFTFGDLHIYSNHVNQCLTQIRRPPFKSPTIDLSRMPVKRGSGMDTIKAFIENEDTITLIDYRHHPAIAAEVAV